MGMYDTFEADGDCPECAVVNSDWQTKSMSDPMLDRWKVGDLFLQTVPVILIMEGRVHCYTSCDHCNVWLEASALIEKGVFVGLDEISTPKMCYYCKKAHIGVMQYSLNVEGNLLADDCIDKMQRERDGRPSWAEEMDMMWSYAKEGQEENELLG